jgi:hypothetical protein
MRSRALVLFLLLGALPAFAQEKPVDANSERVSIQGCANGRSFVTVEPSGEEPVRVVVGPGRVFRMSGKKDLLKQIKASEGSVLEITGLVRKADLSAPQGMPIDKAGRIRVGGMPANQDPTRSVGRDPLANVATIDVESFRPRPERCPAR